VTARPWTLSDLFVLRHAGFPFEWVEELGVSAELLGDVERLIRGELGPAERERLAGRYAVEHQRLRERLHARAAEPAIQEAVFLSSPDMFENVWVRHLDERPLPPDDSAGRRADRRIYAYLQRLCAKNETTSFFGPMGYGRVEDGPPGDDAPPDGEGAPDGSPHGFTFLPARPRRRTFIAYWAVEALAGRAATEPAIWQALPMRRNPLFEVDPLARVARCEAIDRVRPLSDAELRLLAAVEQHGQARELGLFLGEAPEEVERVAFPLFAAGVLVRRIWFRSDVPDTLAELRAALAALPPSPARSRWMTELDRIDGLRGRFETAALSERRRLLPEMEALFAGLTGLPARRAGGRVYTDRLILNEESGSPFRLRVTPRAAAWLSAAVSPLLELSAAEGDRFQDACADGVRGTWPASSESSSLPAYAARLRGLRIDLPPCPLAHDPERVHVHEVSATACGESHPGRRFALPDICLAWPASGGAPRPLLSRLHHHLLTPSWLFTFCADGDRARLDRVAADFLAGEPVPLVELAAGRHNKGFYAFPGPRVAHAVAELAGRGQSIFRAADLRVALGETGPVLTLPDGRAARLYLPLADLTLHPPFAALGHALVKKPVFGEPAEAHRPRLDLGAATLEREAWTLSTATWGKLRGFELFVEFQRRRLHLGLPRFVFARVAGERKPFLVDTTSPFALELLRHHARGGVAHLEEMSPGPDELWLRDARGRYTFELRVQATREA